MTKLDPVGTPKIKGARKVRRKAQPAPRSEVAAAGGVGRPKARPVYGPPTPKPKVYGPRQSESASYPARVRKVRRKQFQQVYGPKPVNRYEARVQQGRAAGPSVSESRTVVKTGQQAQRAVQQARRSVTDVSASFDPQALRSAIRAGIAPGIREDPKAGVFYVKHNRKLGSDYEVAVHPLGGKHTLLAQRTAQMGDPVHAPALKVLEATAVPSHAIAGLVSGRGASYGIKHKTTFGPLLRKAGFPKVAAGTVGFAADVVTDPTTYVSFGTSAVAKKAALDAAENTARRAALAGMSPDGIATVSRAAAKRAAESAAPGKGLTVKLGRLEAPGVTRATAATGRVVKRAAAKAPAPVKATGTFFREHAQEVRPTIAPAGADQAQFQSVRAASRGVRSYTNHQLAVIDSHARGLAQKIGADNYERVINAIETRKIGRLPDELKQPAIFLRSQFRHAAKLRKQAGLGEGTIRDYFPHAQAEPLTAGEGIAETLTKKPGKRSGRIVRPPSSSEQRTLRLPISQANPILAAEGRGAFSTDVPLVYSNYQRETLRDVVAPAELAKRLAQAGRPIKPGKEIHLAPGERVYRLGFESSGSSSHVVGKTKTGGEVVVRHPSGKGRFGLRPLSPVEEQALANPNARHSGQYVALHEKVVEDAAAQSAPMQATTRAGQTLDRVTRGFKAVATATPGFHARNLVGDVQMGYLSQPGHRLPLNLYQAGRAIRGLHAQQKAAEDLAHGVDASGKTIKVAGKQMPVGEFLKLAQTHGVTQSGYLTRELADLGAKAGQGVKKAGRVRAGARRAGRAVTQNPVSKALLQDRENVVRLATFKHGLDTGLSAHDAASLSLGTHIDYADLTHFERKYARRLMPFYTFSARALPLHVKTLVTRPGKFANIEKAREEIGGTNASGYSPYVQRQVPFNVGKKGVTDALPLTLLNEVPVSTKPGEYVSELGQFGGSLLHPIPKALIETWTGRSLAFRSDIEDPKHPLVSAPDWVAGLPKGTKAKLGIVQGPDSRTGKTVWKWPGHVDYAMHQVALGPFNIAQQAATSGTGHTGQGRVSKLVAGATGVRVVPQDKVTQQINNLYTDLNSLGKKQAGLGEQINPANGRKISAKNPTPEYKKIAALMHAKEVQIYNLSKKRGDKVLPKLGAPPKPRGGGSVGGGFGGFGSGFGGGFN